MRDGKEVKWMKGKRTRIKNGGSMKESENGREENHGQGERSEKEMREVEEETDGMNREQTDEDKGRRKRKK